MTIVTKARSIAALYMFVPKNWQRHLLSGNHLMRPYWNICPLFKLGNTLVITLLIPPYRRSVWVCAAHKCAECLHEFFLRTSDVFETCKLFSLVCRSASSSLLLRGIAALVITYLMLPSTGTARKGRRSALNKPCLPGICHTDWRVRSFKAQPQSYIQLSLKVHWSLTRLTNSRLWTPQFRGQRAGRGSSSGDFRERMRLHNKYRKTLSNYMMLLGAHGS